MSTVYPEKNRFYVRVAWPTLASIPMGESRNIYYTLGNKKVLVGLRNINFVCQELEISIYVGTTGVTGGTPITIRNFNTTDGISSVGTATKDVTFSDIGTRIDDPEYLYGEARSVSRDAEHIPDQRLRVYAGNTSFLVVFKNNSVDPSSLPALVSYYLDWLEIEEDI